MDVLPPLHPAEVALAQLRFIDVEEAVAGLSELGVLEGPLLLEDEVLRRVDVVGGLDDDLW